MEKNLVELVKERKYLYDMRHKHYRNKELKARMWKEIATKINVTPEQAKQRWVTLRDGYRREQKRREQGLKGKIWKYFNMLSFLDNFAKPKLWDQLNEEREFQEISEGEFSETPTKVIKDLYNDFCSEMELENRCDFLQSSSKDVDYIQEKPELEYNDYSPTTSQNEFHERNLPEKSSKIESIDVSKLNRKQDENEEDSAFLQLLAIKMRKMSQIEKSAFQLKVLQNADNTIFKNKSNFDRKDD